MRFLHLTLLFGILNVFSSKLALEYPPSSSTKTLKAIPTHRTETNDVEPGVTNITLLQSNDGGQTWQDISQSLPEDGQPEDFFAGDTELYLRINDAMYRSKSNLKTPVWEKAGAPGASIAFNRSGVMAFNYEGQVYRKASSGKWSPTYTSFDKHTLRMVFETSDGTVFLGSDNGLYKSADKGQSWKRVQNEGWVGDMVETDGVLVATGQSGIMRSTDKGEHWEWVISEGGVGIAIERIEGGFAAISYSGSAKSRRVRISLDRGETWKAIDDELPPSLSISSIKQIGPYLICGHPDGIFRSSDMGSTWSMVHPSVDNAFKIFVSLSPVPARDDRKVFKIYVSGNVLYAVARNAGC